MTPDEMNKLGKDSMETAMKSVEGSAAHWEKLLGVKSLEKAMEVQTEYLKSSYEGFVAEATKLGELYVDFAKEAYKPFESAYTKASAMK